MNNKNIFVFPKYAPNIYADEKGKFFSIENNLPLKMKSYNGCLCVVYNGVRYGVSKLRKNALKKQVELEENIPF